MPVPVRNGIASKPYWATSDGVTVRLFWGDVIERLRELPAASVHCVVTSPPYWGLRDYGVEGQIGAEPIPDCEEPRRTGGLDLCGECFVCNMVAVFRQVRRVLRDDGTLWLNLGDSYNQNTGTGFNSDKSRGGVNVSRLETAKHQLKKKLDSGLPNGNLMGVPWRVALALQNDGWVLRQDIIWRKPDPMPESIKNRCTKAHEYIFLLTKSTKYFYDQEAIKEITEDGKSNKRSVWTVSGRGYEGAHFATFPTKLIDPCVKAGTSEMGCCSKCGVCLSRMVEEREVARRKPEGGLRAQTQELGQMGKNGLRSGHRTMRTETIGWKPGCDCGAETVPCTVLDPFMGSGTTAEVAIANGCRAIGIDLNEDYINNNQVPRIEGALMSRGMSHLLSRTITPMKIKPARTL